MPFFIKIFYFSLVLFYKYDVLESVVEFSFDTIPLGHSGLLITWKPKNTMQSEELSKVEYTFEFFTFIDEGKYDENFEFNDLRNQSLVRENDGCPSSQDQYKIHSLNENTLYIIIVRQFDLRDGEVFRKSLSVLKSYFVRGRTNLKSNRMPTKPYFVMSPGYSSHKLFTHIRWYPCNKEKICHDQESGTHFSITIKQPYNSRQIIEYEELYKDYWNVIFLPGRVYEIVVSSINGEYKTDSDTQEIFFDPVSSPVQYVNVISLPNLSVLIHWKPPKQSLDKSLEYLVKIFNSNEPNTEEILFHKFFKLNRTETLLEFGCKQGKILKMKSDGLHTFSILPFGKKGNGFEYHIKHKHRIYDHDLPVAKPDFSCVLSKEDGMCKFHFQWLPCGQSFDCENSKPGSEYIFRFKPKPLQQNHEENCGSWEGEFDLDLVYEVTVKSLIGSNSSESVTKIFKNCEEIQENIPSSEQSQN